MPYLKIFTAPKDKYYFAWRAWHREKAVCVMLGAAVYALMRWLF